MKPRLISLTEDPTEPDAIEIDSTSIKVSDPEMRRVFVRLRRLASDRIPVLLTGESGVGKEVAAKALHTLSQRASGPMVPVNCGAIPAGLVETELFGHERGAFSGADTPKAGLLESAEGGTVFLDEVGELPLELQVRLLRFLDDRVVRRVGAVRMRPIDVRVVAATNRDLAAEVRDGRFREDLFYRLRVASVRIPPLRERVADIPVLAQDLLDAARVERTLPQATLSTRVRYALLRHTWPGNVRELKHLMELVALTVDGTEVTVAHLADAGFRAFAPDARMENERLDEPPPRLVPLAEQVAAFERKAMIDALEATGWVQRYAAQLLGVSRRTFVSKLKRYGISRTPMTRAAHAGASNAHR